MAEVKNGRKLNVLGGMLSSADFREYVIRKDVPRMKELFRQRKWTDIPEKSFIIYPFNPLNLTPFSYDLSIGDEAFSCRLESQSSFTLGDNKDKAYWVEPGETIIVRTLEYIALPRCYSATVWPRFNFVREGIFQSMVKIDPTWYGQLGVALTNLSPAKYPIWKEKKFATLILYELTQKTDIVLYRSGEILDPENKVEVSLEGVQIDEGDSKIKEKGLEGKCTIKEEKLIIGVALTSEEFDNLMKLYDTEDWKRAVEEAMRMKTMDSLGLPDLDLILAKDPDGQRLTRENVAKSECTPEVLAKMAVERGKPFEVVANMPRLVEERAKGIVELELNKEIGRIILRIMALTISLLGFISLIVTIIALMARQLKLTLPIDVDWNDTLYVTMIAIGLALILVLLYIFSPYRGEKGINKVRKELETVSMELRAKYKKLDYKLRDKTIELQKRIDRIDSKV